MRLKAKNTKQSRKQLKFKDVQLPKQKAAKIAKIQKKPIQKQNVKKHDSNENKIIKKKEKLQKSKEQEIKLTIPKDFTQSYVCCDYDQKLLLLISFLTLKKQQKIIILFTQKSMASVNNNQFKFIEFLFSFMNIETLSKEEFLKKQSGILITNQASNIQADWIIQYDIPEQPKNYLSKVVQFKAQNFLLFLHNNEKAYIDELQKLNAKTFQFDFPQHKLLNRQPLLEKQLEKNYYIYTAAEQAYRFQFLFMNQKQNEIFKISNENCQKFGKQFGFKITPRINLKN